MRRLRDKKTGQWKTRDGKTVSVAKKRRKKPTREHYQRAARAASVVDATNNLEKAMAGADRRGYTGMVGSKGGLFDDPVVKRAKKRYDRVT